MRIPNEIKAGVVILAAIGVGVFFFFKTASFDNKTYNLKTYFTYAGNLKPDAVVKLSGIEVGRLTEINFVYDNGTKVECLLEISENAKVRSDSIAYIDTAGFVGDAYVGITAGTSENFADPGGVIKSEEPIQMRLLMKKADEIAGNMDKTLKDLDDMLLEVKSVITDNKAGIGNIVSNLESTSENLEEFSEDVKNHPWKLLFKGE